MDTNAGRFVEEKNAEAWMQRLAVGEIVKIKGEELRVVVIEDRRVTLELMSHEDRMFAEQEAMQSLLDSRGALRAQQEDRDRAKHGTAFIGGKPPR